MRVRAPAIYLRLMGYPIREEPRLLLPRRHTREQQRPIYPMPSATRRYSSSRLAGSSPGGLAGTIAAYCLMTNHYHLVIKLGELGMSRGMQSSTGVMRSSFNARYARAQPPVRPALLEPGARRRETTCSRRAATSSSIRSEGDDGTFRRWPGAAWRVEHAARATAERSGSSTRSCRWRMDATGRLLRRRVLEPLRCQRPVFRRTSCATPR